MPEPEAVTPYLVALLLCDQAINEAGTNKKTLVGIFGDVLCFEFPAQRSLTLYARLTDAEGTYRMLVEYVQVATNAVLGRVETSEPITIADRLAYHELILHLTVPIPEAGIYELRLFANGAYLGRATFHALAATPPGG